MKEKETDLNTIQKEHLEKVKIKKLIIRFRNVGVMIGFLVNTMFIYTLAYYDSNIPESFREMLSLIMISAGIWSLLFLRHANDEMDSLGFRNVKPIELNDKLKYPELYKLEQNLKRKLD